MGGSAHRKLEDVYPACLSVLGPIQWERTLAACGENCGPETFPDILSRQLNGSPQPQFLPELARLELAVSLSASREDGIPSEVDELTLNPSIELLEFSWKHLPALLHTSPERDSPDPEEGTEHVLLWHEPGTGQIITRSATDEDLLVLKVIAEGRDPRDVAAAGGLPVGAVDAAIERAVERGLLLSPPPRIRRDPAAFPRGENIEERFFSSDVFTLQWHVTQACDLSCKHCYDRSAIPPLEVKQAIRILDDLRAFCRSRGVSGHVSLTGGNPLLHPHITDLYRAATDRGFSIALLGNPAPRGRIEELAAIQHPGFFQVSLEGLEEHNDSIRGAGHFGRVMEFLGVLRDLDVYSMVMLTLTNDNMDQVVPLAHMLRDRADFFTFNRISLVGEGANLEPPDRERFAAFLASYLEAARKNPIMGLKDNLINIILRQKGIEPFGGCAGHGCSAAFNFMTVLPDGEAHACRKFPSPIGNVLEQGIGPVYDGEPARQYRAGCSACRDCSIRPVCGGCLAVSYSHGLDVFTDRDPYCFIDQSR